MPRKQQEEEDDDEVEDVEEDGPRPNVQDQLNRLIDPDYAEKFVSTLHVAVQGRVRALQGMQATLTEVHNKYMEEHKALEKKYEALYAPIFVKRAELVKGEREPTPEEVTKGQGEEYKEPEDAKQEESDAKGIPDFWLTAMKNHDIIGEMIEERDEECLKFLTNITAKSFDDPDTGFTLEFHFAENQFFSNTILTKTYHLVEEDEVVLDKAQGCDIAWKAGKNLTVTMKKKKVKGKGGRAGRQVMKEEPCDSFFNFFKPPQIPEEMEDEEDDEDMGETLEELIEQDYEIGCAIAEQLVPKAVLWYTGEAGDHIEDDDEEDEEGEEDKDDESEEETPPKKGGKGAAGKGAAGKGGSKKGGDPGGAAQPECKQQ
jgi:nucleosome assembly protein 1-like 1